MKRVLITGAGSYVGGKVRERLEQEPEKYSVEELDVQDPSWRDFDFSSFDTVYHVAGIAHVSLDPKMEQLYMSVNRDLAIEVCKKAKSEGCSQFIFMSSAIVYGDSDPCDVFNPITKETPVNPSNFYGRSKAEAEEGLRALEDESFAVAILRCPMIYGPGCKGNFPTLAKMAKRLPIFPDIRNRRSMLYVGNLAELIAVLVDRGEGGLYLPQNAEWSSTPEIVRLMGEALGKKVRLTKAFNPIIKALFKNHPLFIKAFGNLYYAMDESASNIKYQATSLAESLKQYVFDHSASELSNEKIALVAATVPSVIGQFCGSNIKLLQELGYSVQVAANFNETSNWSLERNATYKQQLENQGIPVHQVDFSRNPLALGKHLAAYSEMRKLCANSIVRVLHVNTPIAGAISRIAARNSNTKVLYTAHGFHFYAGAPLKNWLVYYPVEWLCSWFTDVLITINKEDYSRAKKHFHAKKTSYVPGVGVDLKRFSDANKSRTRIRSELGIKDGEFALLSVGELLPNKNHKLVIKALGKLAESNCLNRIKYFICGDGPLKQDLQELADNYGVGDHVQLLGYRDNIPEILAASDAFVFMSIREGLSVALMEAMAAGLPIICSPIRGNVDLVVNGESGLIVDFDEDQLANAISYLESNIDTAVEMGMCAQRTIGAFDKSVAEDNLHKIYSATID